MKILELVKFAFSIQGIKNFFTVYDENEKLDLDQIIGSIIQLIVFSGLIAVIGFFLL